MYDLTNNCILMIFLSNCITVLKNNHKKKFFKIIIKINKLAKMEKKKTLKWHKKKRDFKRTVQCNRYSTETVFNLEVLSQTD